MRILLVGIAIVGMLLVVTRSYACDNVLMLRNCYGGAEAIAAVNTGCVQSQAVVQAYSAPVLQNVAYQSAYVAPLLQRQYVQQQRVQVLQQNAYAYQQPNNVLLLQNKYGGPLLIKDRSRQRGQVVKIRDERRGLGRLLLGK